MLCCHIYLSDRVIKANAMNQAGIIRETFEMIFKNFESGAENVL